MPTKEKTGVSSEPLVPKRKGRPKVIDRDEFCCVGKPDLTLLLCFFSIFFLKSFNSSSRIQKFLFSGEERMTVRADLDMDLLLRALRLEGSATGTLNHRIKNFGMNIFFHLSNLQTPILPIFHKFSNFF